MAARNLLGLLTLAISACTTVPPPAGTVRPESISYETGPCFGACPVYKVTVTSAGEGLFEGRRFTAVTGERRFRLTQAEYDAFVAQLDPLRPDSGSERFDGPPRCRQMATDLPSASVVWNWSEGGEQSLYYYFGCDMEETKAMAERLRSAPALLPIGSFIRSAASGG